MTYGKKLLVAIDQLFNALSGGWPRRIVDGLPFWKAGHCLRAYEGERKRL